MTIAGFRSTNHPQQVKVRGAVAADDDRGTTWEDFTPLHERFHFTVDVAAAAHNAKLPRYYTIEDDGLTQSWAGERVWCNPPYSDCRAWVQKAWNEFDLLLPFGRNAKLIVMLLPANRTEQGWWQDLVEPALRFRHPMFRAEFIRGRMRFDRPNAVIDPRGDRPPFGNVLLIWGTESAGVSHEGQQK